MSDPMSDHVEELVKRRTQAMDPADERASERHRAQGKLTARERVGLLLDAGSFRETDLLVFPDTQAAGMEGKRAYTDGVITGWGKVDGRRVFVFSQDARIVGGSVGEAGGAKIRRLMDLAVEAGAPIVGINDGGGARIQEGVAALAAYGAIFSGNAAASGVVPQISVIMGLATGGAVYSPALTDFVFMVEGTSGMSITGPDVVRAATGESLSFEELGGATAHGTRSGVAHFVAKDELSCLAAVRHLLGFLPSNWQAAPPVIESRDPEADGGLEGPAEALPSDPATPYDIRRLVERVLDAGGLLEYSAGWARNVVCGFGRLAGRAVGIVANQPLVLAGVVDIAAAQKAARFVRTCDAFGVPILVVVDTPGFLPGTDQEYGGLIRHGAKLLYAFCEATVPRIQLVVRKAYGGAYVVMGAKSTGTPLAYAWPSAELSVMGAAGAVEVLFGREIQAADDPAAHRAELRDRYHGEFVNPYQAAARGYLSDVIEPSETREALIEGFELLANGEARPVPRKHGNVPL